MKRTLTSIAAAGVVLGSFVPAAFAATTNHNVFVAKPNYNQRTVSLGSYTANVKGIVAKDGSVSTEFLPVWYVQQGLKSMGYNVTWDGDNMILNITTPTGATVDTSNPVIGTGDIAIQINGTMVQSAPHLVAKDPASGVGTTYVPVWYLEQVMKRMGFINSYDGHTWKEVANDFAVAGNNNVAIGGKDTLSLTSKTQTVDASKVTWSVDGNGAAVVDANGNFVASAAGTYNVTATYEGVTATAKVVVYGAATGISVVTPQQLVANNASEQTLTINAVDANGQVAAGYNGTATVTSTGSAFTIPTDSTQASDYSAGTLTFTNGVATLVVKSGTVPGISGTLTVTSTGSNELKDAAGNAIVATSTLSTVAQVATAIKVTDADKYVEANDGLGTTTYTVQVVDQAGQPMLGGVYNLTGALAGGGTFTDGTTSNELIQVSSTAGTSVTVKAPKGVAGNYNLTVTGTGLTTGSYAVPAAIAQSASKLSLADTTDSAVSFVEGASNITVNVGTTDVNNVPTGGLTAAHTYEAYITGANNAAFTNATLTIIGGANNGAAATKGADGTGYLIPADATGFTVSDSSLNADAGTYNIALKDITTTTGVTALTASPALSFAITPQSTIGKIGLTAAKNVLSGTASSFNTTLTAQVEDANGNAISGNGAAVTFTLTPGGSNKGTGSFANTLGTQIVTVDSTGKATVTFNAQNYNGDTYAVQAASNGQTATANEYIVSYPAASYSYKLQDNAGSGNYAGSYVYAAAGDQIRVANSTGALSLVNAALDSNGNAATAGNDNVTLTINHFSGVSGFTGVTSTSGTVGTSVAYAVNSTNDSATFTGSLTNVSNYIDGLTITAAKAGAVSFNVSDSSTGANGSASISVVPGTAVTAVAVPAISGLTALTANTVTPITIQLVDAGGNPVVATQDTTITLATTITGAGFQDANHIPQTTLTIAKGSSSVTAYLAVGSATTGSVTITDTTDASSNAFTQSF